MIGLLIFYLSLGMIASLATWRDHSRRHLGITILATCVISNVLFFTMPPPIRPAVQPIFDVVIIGAAVAAAWPRRGIDIPIVIALASLSACASLAHGIVHNGFGLWELTTNILYALQCATVSAKGVRDATSYANRHGLVRHPFVWLGAYRSRRLARPQDDFRGSR